MDNILFQPSPKASKSKKRKSTTSSSDIDAKKKCNKRIFSNLPDEKPEPEELSQVSVHYFMTPSNNF